MGALNPIEEGVLDAVGVNLRADFVGGGEEVSFGNELSERREGEVTTGEAVLGVSGETEEGEKGEGDGVVGGDRDIGLGGHFEIGSGVSTNVFDEGGADLVVLNEDSAGESVFERLDIFQKGEGDGEAVFELFGSSGLLAFVLRLVEGGEAGEVFVGWRDGVVVPGEAVDGFLGNAKGFESFGVSEDSIEGLDDVGAGAPGRIEGAFFELIVSVTTENVVEEAAVATTPAVDSLFDVTD